MSGSGSGEARLAEALRPFLAASAPRPRAVLLAVSGGADSMALLHAAATFPDRPALHVATIDHGLRPDSAAEARMVADHAAQLQLGHAVLTWDEPARGAHLQEAARAARYRLLHDRAAALGADLVLTAHHGDDQAETVLMRLIAGSGPAGLAGMRARRPLGQNVTLGRPFLALAKSELVAHCQAHGLPFVQDPSNRDDRFGRVRMRDVLPRLAGEGLSAQRLCVLAARAGRDDDALTWVAAAVFEAARLPSEQGRIELDGSRLAAEPEALIVRVIDAAIARVAAGTAQPVAKRLDRLEDLVLGALCPALEAGEPLRRTLRGVLIEVTKAGRIRLAPAPPRRARPAD